jgi:hypothetical protein
MYSRPERRAICAYERAWPPGSVRNLLTQAGRTPRLFRRPDRSASTRGSESVAARSPCRACERVTIRRGAAASSTTSCIGAGAPLLHRTHRRILNASNSLLIERNPGVAYLLTLSAFQSGADSSLSSRADVARYWAGRATCALSLGVDQPADLNQPADRTSSTHRSTGGY